MAASVLVDAGFLVALLSSRDTHHKWAARQAGEFPPPWQTCEAALSEAFHLLASRGTSKLAALLEREAIDISFKLNSELDTVLTLMRKYVDVPMSLADASLVRMTEVLPNPVVLTTDSDFRFYRRHSRKSIPSVLPR